MKVLFNINSMLKKNYNIYSKIIAIFSLSLVFFIPLTAIAATKSLVLFPLTIYADQSKAFLGQGIKRMLISRISGEDIEIISDEKYISLLDEKEKEGLISKKKGRGAGQRS